MENSIVQKQRKYFYTGITLSYEFRKEKLKTLKRAILLHYDKIIAALKKDLNKSETESITTEIGMVLSEINYHLKHLKKEMKPKKVPTSILFKPAKSYILLKPLGVTLIISPWNYPFQLTMLPLAAAIASGNTVVVKPSKNSYETTLIMKIIIEENFDNNYISFFFGGRDEANKLLEMDFDHIFFTGSVNVGKTVLEKASHSLSKVTLELGGKSPCIVDKSTNIKDAARKIAFGKLINCGQTCIAPDYLIVHKDIKEEFLKELSIAFEKMYPNPLENEDYPKIISLNHFTRVTSLIDNNNIYYGGKYDLQTLKIMPTIIDNAENNKAMKEEIFGPIFPVLTFNNKEEIASLVRLNPYPLAFYIYANDPSFIKYLIKNNQFGGCSINDCLSHIVNHHLPFGGVRYSGHGHYHGFYSFLEFSHETAIYSKSTKIDMKFKYMPYSEKTKKLIKSIYIPKNKEV